MYRKLYFWVFWDHQRDIWMKGIRISIAKIEDISVLRYIAQKVCDVSSIEKWTEWQRNLWYNRKGKKLKNDEN